MGLCCLMNHTFFADLSWTCCGLLVPLRKNRSLRISTSPRFTLARVCCFCTCCEKKIDPWASSPFEFTPYFVVGLPIQKPYNLMNNPKWLAKSPSLLRSANIAHMFVIVESTKFPCWMVEWFWIPMPVSILMLKSHWWISKGSGEIHRGFWRWKQIPTFDA